MAKTKQEITDIISAKLFPIHYNALTFDNLKGVVAALPVEGRDKLLQGVLSGKDVLVGQFLRESMIQFAKDAADTQAASLLADDNLTLAELQVIYP